MTTKGERLSSQLMRVLMIMQTLYGEKLNGLTVAEISERIDGKWCDRTIRRDMETLVALGFCTRKEIAYKGDAFWIREYRYSVSVAAVSQKLHLPSSHQRKAIAK